MKVFRLVLLLSSLETLPVKLTRHRFPAKADIFSSVYHFGNNIFVCRGFVLRKESGEVKPWLPGDMFHSSSRTADKFAEEYDRHGDSYTENATSESLKKVFASVHEKVSLH